ncbi:MAG: hypothetical protein L6R00_13640 [Phycisphaerae bacterium]|nr:hypothetical protein [Phycisphaerae bacterium]
MLQPKRIATLFVFIAPAIAAAQPLHSDGRYLLDPIYDSQAPGLGPIGLISSATALSGLAGRDVLTVPLPAEAPSAPRFTLPGTIGGAPAFPAAFCVSDGAHILTAQSGAPSGATFAGEAYLTPAGGGATTVATINGPYDATLRGGAFVVSAAHGADSFGESTGIYGGVFGDYQGNGLYAMSIAGGSVAGLDLLFDTGAYSGAVTADPATGDLYFALGGDSATLGGAPAGYNDIWVIKAADIAAAIGPGAVSPVSADYVASIGFNDFITGFAFDPAGGLLVGLTDFGFGPDRIVRYDIDASNPADYAGTSSGAVVTGADASVRILDFVLDGNVLRVTAIPEPATLLLLIGGLASRRARRRSSAQGEWMA